MTLLALALACSTPAPQPEGPAPAPAPAPVEPAMRKERAPQVEFALPTREGRSPAPLASDPKVMNELERVRGVLLKVVQDHGRDARNPWAIGHAMLALGPDVELDNGKGAVEWLFSEYAEIAQVGDIELVTFPASKGGVRVEPHTDLVLKVLTESGFGPERGVTVAGRSFVLEDLYRYSLWRAWVKGTTTGFREGNFNDSPWALQGIAAWAPPGLAWVAQGGRNMTLDDLTTAVVDALDHESRELSAGMEQGVIVKKDTRRGLFRYTCGGQHLIGGAAYAVARGFGPSDGRQRICRQLDILQYRIDVELGAIDPILQTTQDRPVKVILLTQRLKFLGHYLETVHKIAAMDLCELDQGHRQSLERVTVELLRTVKALEDLGVLTDVASVRTDTSLDAMRGAEQVYLDLIGDSAHAIRGIDLATGKGTVRY